MLLSRHNKQKEGGNIKMNELEATLKTLIINKYGSLKNFPIL